MTRYFNFCLALSWAACSDIAYTFHAPGFAIYAALASVVTMLYDIARAIREHR